MKLAERLSRISEPQTIMMAKLSRELKAQGIDVVDLSLGEPDFDTPNHIRAAAKSAIDDGHTHYTPVAGIADLKKAVVHKLKRDNNLDYSPEQVVVSTGAKQSLANVVLSLVDPGDEVIIPTPYWVTYAALVNLCQGKIVTIKGSFEHDFKITPEQLEAAITPKTKLFMFSSPCNPSGAVYTKDELEALAAVFSKHPEVFVISDEIYEYINYDGQHASIAQFESMPERTIIVNGLSKGFAMTGWRLGYIVAPLEIAKATEKLQGQFTSGTSSITQYAAVAALINDTSTAVEMVKAFRERRDLFFDLLKDIPGLKINKPEGAFYLFPDISSFFGKSYEGQVIKDSSDLCAYLLHRAHVTTVSGDAFEEPNCIRMSYATSTEKLKLAAERLRTWLAKLQ
ncbi:aspartate aminotransferase [Chitinophaga caeni]|uniref:Aminotransferase n=1 Tax=Chitinophaga caeni TaxID=2029983 RepID=A0A291QV92_9BACT|nr:pyridoxal phosphate-dependent aminotransferase [Chitinophaga caeni]ATL47860.1 aspartate aminotransferase [Chitinophaga caeni]